MVCPLCMELGCARRGTSHLLGSVMRSGIGIRRATRRSRVRVTSRAKRPQSPKRTPVTGGRPSLADDDAKCASPLKVDRRRGGSGWVGAPCDSAPRPTGMSSRECRGGVVGVVTVGGRGLMRARDRDSHFWDNAWGGLPVRSRHRVERPGVTIPSDTCGTTFRGFVRKGRNGKRALPSLTVATKRSGTSHDRVSQVVDITAKSPPR